MPPSEKALAIVLEKILRVQEAQQRTMSNMLKSQEEENDLQHLQLAKIETLIKDLPRQFDLLAKDLLKAFEERLNKDTKPPLEILNELIDDIRQGVYMRRQGMSPWPKTDAPAALPPPPTPETKPAVIDHKKGDDTASFRLLKDGGMELNLSGAAKAKLFFWIATAGTSVVLAIRAIVQALQ